MLRDHVRNKKTFADHSSDEPPRCPLRCASMRVLLSTFHHSITTPTIFSHGAGSLRSLLHPLRVVSFTQLLVHVRDWVPRGQNTFVPSTYRQEYRTNSKFLLLFPQQIFLLMFSTWQTQASLRWRIIHRMNFATCLLRAEMKQN